MRNRALLLASMVAVGGLVAGCAGVGASREATAQAGSPTATAAGGVPAGALVLSGTCNADAVSYAVGKTATQALQSEVITKSLAKTLRVIRPGESVTMEFSSQRLNLDVDSSNRVTAVRCG